MLYKEEEEVGYKEGEMIDVVSSRSFSRDKILLIPFHIRIVDFCYFVILPAVIFPPVVIFPPPIV